MVIRTTTQDDKEIIRESLINMYWNDKMSLREIAKKKQTHLTYVYLLFRELGIRTRTLKESSKIRYKNEKLRAKLIQNQKVFIPQVQEKQ